MKKSTSKEIFGWCMFDFANSAYTTIIITTIYSIFFAKTIAGNDNDSSYGTHLWGITLAISYFVVVLISPIIGAIADYSNLKKRFLFFSYLICVISTLLLFFPTKGDVLFAMIFVILSNIGFSASENFCSSFLPDIASEKDIGRISGYGWAFGYIGGILALILCLVLLQYTAVDGEFTDLGIRLTNILTALFFGLAAVPTFLWVKERKNNKIVSDQKKIIFNGFKRVYETFKSIRNFKELFKFLLVFFIYYTGIATVISYSAIYATEALKFTNSEIIILIIVVNTTSSIGAFIFGFIQDKIGAKTTLLITLMLWVITLGMTYLITPTSTSNVTSNIKLLFWISANLAGICMGSSQSSGRAMIGLFSPISKTAEFYGFWGIAGKGASIVGIYSFGLLVLLTGSQKYAMLLALLTFIIGLVLMFFVSEKKGIQNAKDWNENYRIDA